MITDTKYLGNGVIPNGWLFHWRLVTELPGWGAPVATERPADSCARKSLARTSAAALHPRPSLPASREAQKVG